MDIHQVPYFMGCLHNMNYWFPPNPVVLLYTPEFCALVDCNHHAMTAPFEYRCSLVWNSLQVESCVEPRLEQDTLSTAYSTHWFNQSSRHDWAIIVDSDVKDQNKQNKNEPCTLSPDLGPNYLQKSSADDNFRSLRPEFFY